MKKLFTLTMAVMLAVAAMAEVKTVYVNPLVNSANANSVVAKRLYKKGLLGLTKAKTISVASGTTSVTPGTPEAAAYDYILTMDLNEVSVEEAATLGNIANELGNLFGSKSQKKTDPELSASLVTEITLVDASNGNKVYSTTLSPSDIDKDKETAIFNASKNFDTDMTDLTDDIFKVAGEIVEGVKVDKKGIIKTARLNVGAKNGARKDQSYAIYKVVGEDSELLGAGKCQQVLNADECVISITGKKGADKVISELIQNNDGSYQVVAVSCSKSGFLHDNFKDVDKMFTKEVKPEYLDPFGRTSKPVIGFHAVEINDNSFSSTEDEFISKVLEGMNNVPTIVVKPTIYPNVESAKADGIDGLVEITVDKVKNTTEKNSEGKTEYKTEVLYTVSGIDVINNKWIDMREFSDLGSSTESKAKANVDALSLMDNWVQKYCEEIFPVAASIVEATEVKKDAVKKASINVGTDMGVKKGMTFEIYEQRKEGGAESRYLLGEGKVDKNGLTATEAIINVKGKNDGDERLYQLLQNVDENTEVILVSKPNYDVLEKGIEFLRRF